MPPTKRELVEKWRKLAADYEAAAEAFEVRATWDKHIKPVTRAENLHALAKMAREHAMALDTSK